MLLEKVKTNKEPARPKVATPIRIVSATKSTTTATIVFNQPVVQKGTPAYTTNLAGITALSATMTSPTTLVITFSASIATATTLTIPFMEPAIRNQVGGFVADTSFPLS